MNRTPPGVLFLLGLLTAVLGAETPPDFEREVLPIFYNHCWSCHSEKQTKPKAGLRLDSVSGMREGEVLVPGDASKSELWRRATLPGNDEEVMPPIKGGAQPLNERERDVLRRWIEGGAGFGSWERFDHRGKPRTGGDRVADARELTRKIDHAVDAHHARNGSTQNPPADDETFLRRVYLDVMGRIPTLAESDRFLQNHSPERRAALIEELISSSGFTSHFFNWKADQLRLMGLGIAGQPGWLYDAWVKDAIRSGMPYDEFVRGLVTAKGYLWENGAVGFYLRDLGMPLDHMANLSRVFLGTRIECAQCHDHPLQPVTQRDFYQMAAFTAGVSNLASSSGYSEHNVRQWPELKQKLDAMKADSALRQGVSRTISYLKRLTTDTGKALVYPDAFAGDPALRSQAVSPQTLFGEPLEASSGAPREDFAHWMTSPRNPRFAANIANRLWKWVMGVGLVEPVDGFSVLPPGPHAELVQLLADGMVSLRFDERAFLAAVLSTRGYQSESVRETPVPGAPSDLRGPLLRRLSAEQVWDSCLTLIVPDVDERASARRTEGTLLDPQRLRGLSAMSADEILQRARDEMEYREKDRAFRLSRVDKARELAAAEASGDTERVRALEAESARAAEAFFSPRLRGLQMGAAFFAKESDARWRNIPDRLVRASEIPLPLPIGHFLRQFGQSDRREIDAYNRDPNTTHALALMNGELTGRILAEDSHVQRSLAALGQKDEEDKKGGNRDDLLRRIYRAVLVRSVSDEELGEVNALLRGSPAPARDALWALLNSPEFLFNH